MFASQNSGECGDEAGALAFLVKITVLLYSKDLQQRSRLFRRFSPVFSSPNNKQRGEGAGAFAFLVKPSSVLSSEDDQRGAMCAPSPFSSTQPPSYLSRFVPICHYSTRAHGRITPFL